MTMLELCPERTLEKHIVSTVLSGREVTPGFPATAWLANFRRRFATKNGFYKALWTLDLPSASHQNKAKHAETRLITLNHGKVSPPCVLPPSYLVQNQRPSYLIVPNRSLEGGVPFSHRLPPASARPFRIYGPRTTDYGLLPKYQLPSRGSLIVCWAFPVYRAEAKRRRASSGRETVLYRSRVGGGPVASKPQRRRATKTLKTIPCSAGCSVAAVCDRRKN